MWYISGYVNVDGYLGVREHNGKTYRTRVFPNITYSKFWNDGVHLQWDILVKQYTYFLV